MELSVDISPCDLSDPLNGARSMLIALDKRDSRSFYTSLRRNTDHFPLTWAKFDSFDQHHLSKMVASKLSQLREALESDIQPLVAKVHVEVQQTKTVFGETLPDDLDQCLKKLEEIKKRKKQEIHRLQDEIDLIGGAVSTVEQIQKNQIIAENFSSAVKKQKI